MGNIALKDYSDWDDSIKRGIFTEQEKEIFTALSPNEGNLDSVQSYDSEILTAGAMQKTVNTQGEGEFPKQVLQFKQNHPNLYTELFEDHGWYVVPRTNPYMYYIDPRGNKKYEKSALKTLIRTNYTAATQGKKLECVPLEAILMAIKNNHYQELQVIDFKNRLTIVMAIRVSGYTLGNYLLSSLGRATAVEHHINRPGYVASDFKAALDRFFVANPKVSKDPTKWGAQHSVYERQILDDYGVNRRMSNHGDGTPSAPSRYRRIKAQLGV